MQTKIAYFCLIISLISIEFSKQLSDFLSYQFTSIYHAIDVPWIFLLGMTYTCARRLHGMVGFLDNLAPATFAAVYDSI